MAYATQADITELYGANALVVADRNRDGIIDTIAVTRALDMASGEMDTYIGRRYTLPLPVTPSHLVQLCVDIALYRLALSQDVATSEHRTRYEDALSVLTKIANGIIALVLPATDPDGGTDDGVDVVGAQPVVVGGPERLFTREKLRDL